MNIRKARERLGLTMAELAEFAGVSITSISNIENKKKVSDKTLAKVVNTLMELEHYEVFWGKKEE
jgi:transcriptional regulator with XRE-family HTH domain